MGIDPGDRSPMDIGSVMIAIGADCAMLYFRATEPMNATELALFLAFHAALAGMSSWQHPFDAVKKGTYHRIMLPHRTGMAGYGPPYVMGKKEFDMMKLALGSRLEVQLEIRQIIARPALLAESAAPGPAEGMARFVNEIGGVVTANRDIAKLQRRLRVAGKIFNTGAAKEEDREHSAIIEDEYLQYARLPEALLSARNAVLVRYMGLNSPALAAVVKRVTTGGGTIGGDIAGCNTTTDVTRRRGMRARMLAAEACVARHQHQGGRLWEAVKERDEARSGAFVAKQALVDLEKGREKRAKQLIELKTLLGKQTLERRNNKQERERQTELAEAANKHADDEKGIAEGHEEKLELFRQEVETRQKGFQDDQEAMEKEISKIRDPDGRSLRQTVAELETKKMRLQGELKGLTSGTKKMKARIKELERKRKKELQRRRHPEANLEGASTDECPNPSRVQHPTQERFESSGPTRRGGSGGRGRGGRGPSKPTCAQNLTVEAGAARSRGAGCDDQLGKLLAKASPVDYYSGNSSNRVPSPKQTTTTVSGNVDGHVERNVGVIGRPISTLASKNNPTLTSRGQPLCEAENGPGRAVPRGVHPEGSAPPGASSTSAAGLPVAQPQPSRAPPSFEHSIAARASPFRAPRGFDRAVGAGRPQVGHATDAATLDMEHEDGIFTARDVLGGGFGGGAVSGMFPGVGEEAKGSDNDNKKVNIGNTIGGEEKIKEEDENDGLPRTLEGLLVRCDCVQHLELLKVKGITVRSIKKLTLDQLKVYGLDQVRHFYVWPSIAHTYSSSSSSSSSSSANVASSVNRRDLAMFAGSPELPTNRS